MPIVTATGDNFSELAEQNELVVVDFWAQWCGPCLAYNTIVETVSKEYPDVVFAKVNIEEEEDLAAEFDVQSVPAVLILRSQVVVFAESGSLSAGALKDLLDQAKLLDVEKLKSQTRSE